MKRTILVWLLAISLVTAGCRQAPPPTGDPSVAASSSSSIPLDDAPIDGQSSSSDGQPSGDADPQKAAQEQAKSEAAAQKAAQEQAESEAAAQKAAQERAESEAAAQKAAQERAESEAVAQKAAQEQAESEAAAQRAAQEESQKAEEDAKQEQLDRLAQYASGSGFLGKVEQSVLNLTNDERERNGLDRLELDTTLRQAARIRSRELYENDHFDHTRPNGDSWVTVLTDDLSYTFHHTGENLASVEYNDPNGTYAYDSVYWVTTWIESPPHYENMLRDTYTKIGVGIYLVEEGDTTIAYATTLFSD